MAEAMDMAGGTKVRGNQDVGPSGASAAARVYTVNGLARSSPWSTAFTPGRRGRGDGAPGLVITPIVDCIVVGVSVRDDKREPLSHALQARFGLALPDERRFVAFAGGRIAWDGPGRYRIVAPAGDAAQVDAVAEVARGFAAVVDQSHGAALVQISGSQVDAVLAKGTSMEIARVFPTGGVAVTSLGHLPAHLTRLDDVPTVEIATLRSMAQDMAEWLTTSASMYGIMVREARSLGAQI